MTLHCSVARSGYRLCCRRFSGTAKKPTGGEGGGQSKGGSCGGLYDARKYGHVLPCNDVLTPFDPLCPIPTGVFRNTCGEVLGPFAGKCAFYRNPEYYSFHHMSYFDLQLSLFCCRMPQPKTGRKP